MKTRREIVITFEEVKDYIKQNSQYHIDELIDCTEAFVMYYMDHPFGFAETDRENSIENCLTWFNQQCKWIMVEKKSEQKRMINSIIRQQNQRWFSDRNASACGRFIGRLAHLLNEQKLAELV